MAFAITCYAATLYWVPIHLLGAVACVIGGIFPDADHRHAPMGRWIPLWVVCKHRGFTHTLWGMWLFTAAVGAIVSAVTDTSGTDLMAAAYFALGYMSHLVADATTPMGIRWLGQTVQTGQRGRIRKRGRRN